jgi:DNA-binding transcriptional ArsR family regulator
MGLLPSSPDVSGDGSPRVVDVDSDDADELVSALGSETAREILSTLHEEPAPPSTIADRVDTSLQNAQYHLGRLEAAGAVEVAGTAYSEKGREMDVFAPADEPLVIVAGGEEESSRLRDALRRLVGGIGVLAVGSLVVQALAGELPLPIAQSGGAGGGDAGEKAVVGEATAPTANSTTATPTPTETATETAGTATEGGVTAFDAATSTPTATSEPTAIPTATPTPTPTSTEVAATTATDPGVGTTLATLPPGVLFFLGGLVVLVGALALR